MLSVVIPSYNDAKNISLAIASADQIKYVNEIIVVDDCSTDNTKSLIKEISTNCKKIKYFKNNLNSKKFVYKIQIKSIKNNMENVAISINHESYRHSAILNTL